MDQPTSENFGNVPQPSAPFGNLPQDSETFGTIPKASEPFRTVRKISERTQNHTLTVQEVARLFEKGGAPRTERSIINWCQLNRQGVARLDAFFDENEGRYFITPQSVTLAIGEEIAKRPPPAPQPEPELPKQSEPVGNAASEKSHRPSEPDDEETRDLRRKVMDLEITNRVKEQLLTRLNDELIRKDEERRTYIERLIADSRRIGELESQVLQLGAPVQSKYDLPKPADSFRAVPHDMETTRETEIHSQVEATS